MKPRTQTQKDPKVGIIQDCQECSAGQKSHHGQIKTLRKPIFESTFRVNAKTREDLQSLGEDAKRRFEYPFRVFA